MPGTLTIKPIQANFTHNKDFLLNKQDPYCEILLGGQKVTTTTCKHGGKHPYWSDAFTLQSNNEPVLYVNIKDKDRFSHDDNIGSVQVDLKNVSSIPRGPQWYPVIGGDGSQGEILIDIAYNPGMQAGYPGQMPTMMPTMPMQQPTMGYPTTQPMTGYPVSQPTVGYPQTQPMMQQAYHGVQPTVQPNMGTAYTQPMGQMMPGMQQQQMYPNQGYPNQGYPPNTMGGYGGAYYK